MDLKTFFENFDTLAEAPGGIARLRELILDMAVRGKLVPQDPKDEAAISFLEVALNARKKWFETACKQATQNNQRKPRKPSLSSCSISPENEPFAIPKSWRFCFIADLAAAKEYAIKAGPFGSALKKKDYTESGYKIYGQEQVIKGDAEWGDYYIDQAKFNTLKACAVESGDLLISLVGTIGKTLTLPKQCQPGIINPRLLKFSFHPDLNRTFIETYLASSSAKQILLESSHGGTMNILNLKILSKLPIPIPPLSEQKRIVAKVDELMALCDRAEAAQQTRNTLRKNLRASALDALMNATSDTELETAWNFVQGHWAILCSQVEDVSGFRQAVIQLAVRGKAVYSEDVLPTENSSQLSQQSKAHDRRNKLKIFSIDEEPFELPRLWKWYRLGSILESLRYGTSKKCSYVSQGTPVLRIPNIDTKTGTVEKDDLKFSQLSEKELNNLYLYEHDLLMIRSNGSVSLVGRSAVVDRRFNNYAYAGYLVRLRILKDLIFSEYLRLVLESNSVRQQIELPIRTTSGVKNINSTEIANLLIPLPPLAEQKRIVAKVDELTKQCDRLETILRKKQQLAEALVASATSHLST